ncbi:fluoride efflux transporter CrcB [Pseudobutyrivibrio sp.]|uniref:fluoride efflux transporter CrcB n=1 Tax=Pseudobutyrivibrio sp. TaxID=2014367 RepID=UPI001B75B10A|nr:fluoride efflux transporter CrcB [Pseudobutyrivibrio sp.]MBP3261222.1 fluoride efflux transporter CrcB [Pseudobutyrivibrio sp.]
MDILAVGMGGFVGAVLRYMIGLVPVREATIFPIKTFIINVVGCLAIGVIAVVAAKNPNINPKWILFLKVGICGGFTTFSTFTLETTDLIKSGHMGIAFLYAVLSVVVGVAVIFGVEYAIGK